MKIKNNSIKFLLLFAVSIGFIGFFTNGNFSEKNQKQHYSKKTTTKIGGINFVSPGKKSSFSNFNGLQRINAKWVGFNPYAFSKKEEPFVTFNHTHSWWGEQSGGIIEMLQQAKKENLSVLLKPHVWVMGQGWCGDFDLATETQWLQWESDYKKYILHYAEIAEKFDVEMLCIGTEYKIAATKRDAFFKKLIAEIKTIYNGKITYAANWDNFQNITFWNDLDYIGIDAYFPLAKNQHAEKMELDLAWKDIMNQLQSFSKKHNKQILFTEFGYKSTNFTAWNQWELDNINDNEQVNITAQNNAYLALFENCWDKNWLAGGFLWKWYPNDSNAGGLTNSDYTPQHKPVEKIIATYYN